MRVVVELDGRLDQLLAVFLGLIEQVGRNLVVVILRAERLVVPDDAPSCARDRSRPLKLLSAPIGSWIGDRLGAEAVDDVRRGTGRSRRRSCPSCWRRRCAEPCTCRPGARPSRSAARRPGCESSTHTAPSSTRSERSTSMVKSTWPGVSMMLRRLSFQNAVVAADVIVMPRSCSCSIQSMVAAPSWTSPILWLLPV